MMIDPQFKTGVGRPTQRKPDKHRWRDIGNGMIKDERTGKEIPVAMVRGGAAIVDGHTVTFTDEEWAKLERVAAHRTAQTKGRATFTPEKVLRGFISSALDKPSGWEHPGKK